MVEPALEVTPSAIVSSAPPIGAQEAPQGGIDATSSLDPSLAIVAIVMRCELRSSGCLRHYSAQPIQPCGIIRSNNGDATRRDRSAVFPRSFSRQVGAVRGRSESCGAVALPPHSTRSFGVPARGDLPRARPRQTPRHGRRFLEEPRRRTVVPSVDMAAPRAHSRRARAGRDAMWWRCSGTVTSTCDVSRISGHDLAPHSPRQGQACCVRASARKGRRYFQEVHMSACVRFRRLAFVVVLIATGLVASRRCRCGLGQCVGAHGERSVPYLTSAS